MLGRDMPCFPAGVDTAHLVLVEVTVAEDDSWDGENAPHADGNKNQTGCDSGEGIGGAKNVRKGSEEGKEGGKVKGNVDAKEGDNGFGEEHVEGSHKSDREESLESSFSGKTARDGETSRFCPSAEDRPLQSLL